MLRRRRDLVLLGAMLGASAGAVWMKPTRRYVDRERVPLSNLVPEAFGEWRTDTSFMPIGPAPDVQARLDRLYSDTLSRTYVGATGRRVMLSIAYGEDQGRTLQVHKPEVCYAVQGFAVGGLQKASIDFGTHRLPAMRLVGTRGSRVELITYWIRIGDRIARGWLEQNARRIEFGLKGIIPDGLLFRVSTISDPSPGAYALHDSFVVSLVQATSASHRRMLVGPPGIEAS
jgi:EpsI family protein